ncbi:NLR family, CARD domain containing 5 [Engraulis encrasicolus]|uniref:NLR family, CARD domain containing 5 n=1 Tax=Engraulis encrasicolus TaxID=184585 RepID=UPI002FD103C1
MVSMETDSAGDPEDSVSRVLEQERVSLVDLLSDQDPHVLSQLLCLVEDPGVREGLQLLGDPRQRASGLVDHFQHVGAQAAARFLEAVCMACVDIPMHLESLFMSVSEPATGDIGYQTSTSRSPTAASDVKRPRLDHIQSYTDATKSFLLQKHQRVTKNVAREVRLDETWVSLRRKVIPRGRDRAARPQATTTSSSSTSSSSTSSSSTSSPSTSTTPSSASSELQDVEEAGVEDRVAVTSLLRCPSQATVLLGAAGSGKTLLMYSLAQRWAQGAYPDLMLLFLLEFRQLNSIDQPDVSLRDLLFRFLLPATDDEQAAAVLEYILRNPEKVCFIFDGYDEFRGKFTSANNPRGGGALLRGGAFDPCRPLPMAELLAGLCRQRILPQCTLLVTCRPRDVADLVDVARCRVGELLGFDKDAIREYARHYFRGRRRGGGDGDESLAEEAIRHLTSSRHLLAMCHVPALCHICCVCLEHLFSQERGSGPGGGGVTTTGPKTQKETTTGTITGRTTGTDTITKKMTGREPVQLPSTLTQVYFQILAAFLSRRRTLSNGMEDEDVRRTGDVTHNNVPQVHSHNRNDSMQQTGTNTHNAAAHTTHTPLHKTATQTRNTTHTRDVGVLAELASRIQELGRLALSGLDESRIVFPSERLRPDLAHFGTATGLLCPVDVMLGDGSSRPGVSFMHLTMQEFLAALHLVTSPEVPESRFKSKLTLRTRWTAKNEPKSVFTDSLQLYLCGLLASDCTAHLLQLAGGEGGGVGGAKPHQVVQKRRAQVVKVLESFAASANLSGPKLVELCRCTHEAQDARLAAKVGSRQSFELRNIRLTPVDLEALAYVVTAAAEREEGTEQGAVLDFGGCSMETECLTMLHGCRNVEALVFRSRKYNDEFAEALSAVIPTIQPLTRLQFTNSKLSDAGATELVLALAKCPLLEHVDLSNNLMTDSCLKGILDSFPKLPSLTTLLLGRNSYTWSGLFGLVEKAMNCDTLQRLLIKGAGAMERSEEVQEFNLHFISKHSVNNLNNLDQEEEAAKTLQWTNYSLSETQLKAWCGVLKRCLGLNKLDVSSNALRNKGVKELLGLLPSLGSLQEVILSENGVDLDGMVLIADLLYTCPHLVEVDASHCGDQKLILTFLPSKRKQTTAPRQTRSQRRSCDSTYVEQDTHHLRKTFSLTHSEIQTSSMERLCKTLGKVPGMLDLDFSCGIFEDATIDVLVRNLPCMTALQLLRLSHVQMSTEGALSLVRCLADCPRVQALELRPRGEAFIKFMKTKAEHATCRLTQYQMNCRNMEKLSGILEHCARISHLDLSGNLLKDEGVQVLMDWLPKLRIRKSVNLNTNGLTQAGALHLVSCISCETVVAVEVRLGHEERSLIHFIQESAQEKSLSLRECNFTTEHVQKLVEILLTCPTLVTLELSCKTLLSDSLTILSDLAKLCSLRNLEMRDNGLCSEAIETFFQLVSPHHLQWNISIEEAWMSDEAVVALVAGCLNVNSNIQEIEVTSNLMTLSLAGHRGVTNHSRNSVGTGSSLKSIRFSNCDVKGQHLCALQPALAASALLQEIDLYLNRIGPEGADFIVSILHTLENLRKLSLQTKPPTEYEIVPIIDALRQCPNLQSISLSGCLISDMGAVKLGETLPSLPHLKCIEVICGCRGNFRLSRCSGWSPPRGLEVVRGIAQCRTLEGLRLEHLELSEEALSCLALGLSHMTSMTSLRLSGISMVTASPEQRNITTHTQPLMAALRGCNGMEQIELEAIRLGEMGVQELVKHIPTWTQLRHISLADNCIGDGAGETLLRSLAHCPAVEILNLSKNRLGPASATQLGKVLSRLTCLRVINLSENPITAEGALRLSEGLMNLKQLTKLHLTAVETPELTCVANALRHCVNIEDVSMGWNGCGDEVALKLAEVLPKCVKLRRLDLESNRIRKEGAKSLAENLEFSFSVEVVRLWRNQFISDDERVALRALEPRISFSST